LRHCPTSWKAAGSIFIDIILPPHYDPEVDSASNRNGYQKYLLGGKRGPCVGLKPYHLHVPTVFMSGSLNLLETSGLYRDCFTFFSLLGLRNQTTCAHMTSSFTFEVLSAMNLTSAFVSILTDL